MSTLEDFKDHFRYYKEAAGHVGVEREYFIADERGTIVPWANFIITQAKVRHPPIINDIWCMDQSGGSFASHIGYELSACQIETRTTPMPSLKYLRYQLDDIHTDLTKLLGGLGFKPLALEVGPVDMPLDVYPDPTGRYAQLAETLPIETLRAACRVAGTHVHIGMPDHQTALETYNRVILHCDELCALGDGSLGERLRIYRSMAPDATPHPYSCWQDFYDTACRKGFARNPRDCWTLIRISIHGTIEFRMFGATDSTDQIIAWAKRCRELCGYTD